jgi:hypothetical protein
MYADDMVVIMLVNGKLSCAILMAKENFICINLIYQLCICCIADDGKELQLLGNVLLIAYTYTRKRLRLKGSTVYE